MEKFKVLVILMLMTSAFDTFAQSNQNTLFRHFTAYNEADLESLSNTLHSDITEYTYPAKLVRSSKAEILKSWSSFIIEREPKSSVIEQIAFGNKIITKERIAYMLNGNERLINVVGIYEFKDNKIHKVTFIE